MPEIAYRTAGVDGLTVFYREAGAKRRQVSHYRSRPARIRRPSRPTGRAVPGQPRSDPDAGRTADDALAVHAQRPRHDGQPRRLRARQLLPRSPWCDEIQEPTPSSATSPTPTSLPCRPVTSPSRPRRGDRDRGGRAAIRVAATCESARTINPGSPGAPARHDATVRLDGVQRGTVARLGMSRRRPPPCTRGTSCCRPPPAGLPGPSGTSTEASRPGATSTPTPPAAGPPAPAGRLVHEIQPKDRSGSRRKRRRCATRRQWRHAPGIR